MKKLFASLALALAGILAFGLAGCSPSKTEDPVALEAARDVASTNAKFNAVKWRGENGFQNLSVLSRGDSTQQPNCPQGDGWASIDLLDPESKRVVIKLKCSTYSQNVGCSLDEDFKSRPVLANQEGTCSAQVPYPLKKLEG